MEKVVVTGGAGFVGSHLCEELIKSGKKVISIDNYSTGSVMNHVAGVEYLRGESGDIEKLVKENVETVFHLGEYSRVEQSFDDIEIVWRSNYLPIIDILKFVKTTNAKLIYAGSSTKYGDDGATRQTSPYAWTKSSNTDLINSFSKWEPINYAIMYFYNVYGPREIEDGSYATLIGRYKLAMKKGNPLKIVEPGTQRRNFTYIDDTISAIKLIADYGYGDEYGIGSPEAYSVYEVASMFGGPIEFVPPRLGNRMSAQVMTLKTQQLGWKAKTSLSDYIANLKMNQWNDR